MASAALDWGPQGAKPPDGLAGRKGRFAKPQYGGATYPYFFSFSLFIRGPTPKGNKIRALRYQNQGGWISKSG